MRRLAGTALVVAIALGNATPTLAQSDSQGASKVPQVDSPAPSAADVGRATPPPPVVVPKAELGPVLQAFSRNDYRAVIKAAKSVVERFDDQYRSEKRQVYCAMNPHDKDVLREQGAKDAVIGPEDWCMALYMTAYSQSEVGDKAGAVVTLERLAVLSPMRSQFAVELGYAYRRVGQLDRAIAAYDRGFALAANENEQAEINRLRAAALRGKGYVLIDKNDWDGAERAYRDSQTYEPDSDVARSELEYIKKTRPPLI